MCKNCEEFCKATIQKEKEQLLNQPANQHYQEVRKQLLKEMLSECDRSENEDGRMLVEKFSKELK